MPLPMVMLGAGGHAKVLLDLVQSLGQQVAAVCDPALASGGVTQWRGVNVIGDDQAVFGLKPDECCLINGLGSFPGQHLRFLLHDKFTQQGYRFATLIHPSAVIGGGVVLGEGAQVMAGAVVQADAAIGAGAIINTGALVDHDCRVGDHCHIAPGAVVCGGVSLGQRVHVGTGAKIVQGVSVGEHSVVGAGAVVLRDIPRRHKVLGAALRAAVEIEEDY